MSGFYVEDLDPIHKRAATLGLQLSSFAENERWVAAIFTS